MKLILNNDLRNPIGEQVIRENLFLIKDVWKKHGQPDEIHIKMGRELKNNAKEKQRIRITTCSRNLSQAALLLKSYGPFYPDSYRDESKSQHMVMRKRMARAHIVELNEPQLAKDNEPIDKLKNLTDLTYM